jgi:hypothetical protein
MCLVGGKARDTRANKGKEGERRTNGGGSVVAGWAWTLGTSVMKVGSSWWEGQRLNLYSSKKRSYRNHHLKAENTIRFCLHEGAI